MTLSPRKNLDSTSASETAIRRQSTHILLMKRSLFTGRPFFPLCTGVSVHISFCWQESALSTDLSLPAASRHDASFKHLQHSPESYQTCQQHAPQDPR